MALRPVRIRLLLLLLLFLLIAVIYSVKKPFTKADPVEISPLFLGLVSAIVVDFFGKSGADVTIVSWFHQLSKISPRERRKHGQEEWFNCSPAFIDQTLTHGYDKALQ